LLGRALVALLVVVAIGLVGFAALAWRSALAPITPPPSSAFTPDIVARGAVLASAGYCTTCHTAKGGQPYAGGYPIPTGFGTIYSTNITPDAETGIGAWSEAAFRRAMHQGVARDGSLLFPAFPYDHFTKQSDGDVAALYAYVMTRPPVHASARANTLPFPLNIRALQAGWKLLFFSAGRFQEQPQRGAPWNRGAYLAEGISHCGACHTPRNALGAEERGKAFAGAPIEGWEAPPLTRSNPSPAPWTEDELFAYLRTGVSRLHGTTAGPMSVVVHAGLAKLPDADIRALAVYFADIDDSGARVAKAAPPAGRALATGASGASPIDDPAARLTTVACASCHYNAGATINPLRPDLALNTAVNAPAPTNLIRIMLYGVSAQEGASGVVMPGFAPGLNDADIARIAAYLRATKTAHAAWPDLEKQVASIRKLGKGQE
jgi:mono/diheme cytochrome c family protein